MCPNVLVGTHGHLLERAIAGVVVMRHKVTLVRPMMWQPIEDHPLKLLIKSFYVGIRHC